VTGGSWAAAQDTRSGRQIEREALVAASRKNPGEKDEDRHNMKEGERKSQTRRKYERQKGH
jgi:hypothetical protein